MAGSNIADDIQLYKDNVCQASPLRSILIAVGCCVLLLGHSAANSSESNTLIELAQLSLEELLRYEVVSPTKSDTRLSETPGSVSVITYDQIRNSAAKSIPELLRSLPGIHVRWNPMVQSIEARSFGSNPFTSKVLLLIDGIPYNSWNKGGFPQHPGFDFFNLENVKHIEVIRGAGSALYGENALNAVINIVTLSGDEYRQTRIAAFSGDRNTQSLTLSHGTTLGENSSIFISARKDQGQLPTQFWRAQDAYTSGKDVFIKGKYRALQLSVYRREGKFDGFRQTVGPESAQASFRSIDNISQDINIVAANFQHQAESGAWTTQANASFANRHGTHCGGCHAGSQHQDFSKRIDHGYQAFGNVQLGIHNIPGHDLLIGGEIRRISAGDSFTQIPGSHGDMELTGYKKSALFLQDRISMLNEKLTVFAGLRYDSATSPSLFDDELFPRIAAVFKPSEKLTLRAGWSRAARYPSLTELCQNIVFFGAESETTPGTYPLFPPTNFKPNPDLKAESISSIEVGAEYHFSKNLTAKLDLFHNTNKNPIVMVYGRRTIGFENHPANAIAEGFELELRAEPTPIISSYLNWSYQNNRQKGAGTDSAGMPIEFTYSPRHKANFGLTYRISEGFSATLEGSWRGEHYAPQFWNRIVFNENRHVRLDDYAYINLKMRYRLPFNFGNTQQPLTLSIYAKDLGNERPMETVIGVNGEMPGREFFLSLEYELAN